MPRDLWSVVISLILMILVIYAAYMVSRYIGKKIPRGRCRYMKEQDRLMLGPEQYLSILNVGDRLYLIGVTKQSITLVSELSTEDMKELFQNQNTNFGNGMKDQDFLSKLKNAIANRKSSADINEENSFKDGEE